MSEYKLFGNYDPRTVKESLWITKDGKSICPEDLVDDCNEMQSEIKRLRQELTNVWQAVDDVLFDPALKLVDVGTGEPISGDLLYLYDHPVMDIHVPALREWFVSVQEREPWIGGE